MKRKLDNACEDGVPVEPKCSVTIHSLLFWLILTPCSSGSQAYGRRIHFNTKRGRFRHVIKTNSPPFTPKVYKLLLWSSIFVTPLKTASYFPCFQVYKFYSVFHLLPKKSPLLEEIQASSSFGPRRLHSLALEYCSNPFTSLHLSFFICKIENYDASWSLHSCGKTFFKKKKKTKLFI